MNAFACRLCLILIAALLSLPASAQASGTGHWEFGVHGNLYGAREYQVWLPAGYTGAEALPLVLVLHGCVTDPNLTAAASRFNEIADVEQFIVVYPRQNVTSNPSRCWNWPLAINQARDTGEPSILAGIVAKAKQDYQVDASRVYVTGISAGGAMTSIMMACYSDVFAAGAVHSGGMYKAATTLSGGTYALLFGSIYSPDDRGRSAWQCSGSPTPRPVPMLVFHGSADSTVNPVNGQQTVRQFLQTNDLADDGQDNNSVGNTATSTSTQQVPGGRTYTVSTYSYGGKVLAQHYLVQGMGHAWSGGDGDFPFTDPDGPDASLVSWLFFKDNQR